MRSLYLLLALTLACCAHTKPAPDPFHPWAAERLRLALPVDAPSCALWAADEALKVLSPSTPVEMVAYVPPVAGVPSAGDVWLVWEDPGTGLLGLTITWPNAPDGNRRAVVLLQTCDVRVWAHELGHALGLPDTRNEGTLMHGLYSHGGWNILGPERDVLDRR